LGFFKTSLTSFAIEKHFRDSWNLMTLQFLDPCLHGDDKYCGLFCARNEKAASLRLCSTNASAQLSGFHCLDTGIDATLVASGFVFVDQATSRVTIKNWHGNFVGGFSGNNVITFDGFEDALNGSTQH
jgi:hypothetical protein